MLLVGVKASLLSMLKPVHLVQAGLRMAGRHLMLALDRRIVVGMAYSHMGSFVEEPWRLEAHDRE